MKKYIEPTLKALEIETEEMIAQSVLDPASGTPSVTLTEEPYDGKFSAKQTSVWVE